MKAKKIKLNKKVLLIVFATVACIFLLFLVLVLSGAFGSMPGKSQLEKIQNYTASEVYSSDNYLLGRYYLENRTNTHIEDIPDFFINALIATEDARFYRHKGVDARSMVRVFFKSLLLADRSGGGGSTLTQQLAKNLYGRKRLGIFTIPAAKAREIIIARRLEKVYTKTEILQLYLNTVPFGSNTFGVETASLVFFDKKPAKLNIQEAATLVGMLKGNTDYNPTLNYKAAVERRKTVIGQMVKYHYLSQAEADSLLKLPIEIRYHPLQHDEGPAPYFREHLRLELREWAKNNPKSDGTIYNIYTDGLKIYTTIDYSLQVYAEQSAAEHMKQLQKEFNAHWKGREPWKKKPEIAKEEIMRSDRYKNLSAQKKDHDEIIKIMREPGKTKIFTWEGEKEVQISPLDSIIHHFAMLQTGLLCMESHTGFIKAWVGGINYRYFKYDHVTARRQAGSTFKPVVYAASLEKGVNPCDFYDNDSIVYEDYDNWTPQNSDGRYGGSYSVNGALTHSINTVSAQLIMATGIGEVVSLAHKMGFEGNIPEVPSISLGTADVSLFEMVKAYSVFLNGGFPVVPVYIRRIEDQYGNVLYTGGPEIEEDRVISEITAQTVNVMLCNVVNRGTGAALRSVYGFSNDMAGKTGTTQNNTDGWFIGLTPDLITAVWVGGDNPVVRFRSMMYGQGSHTALPIFARFMQKTYNDRVYRASKNSTFNIPQEVWDRFDCEDYREKEYDTIMDMLEDTEQSITEFLRRIFSKKKKNPKNPGEKENE